MRRLVSIALLSFMSAGVSTFSRSASAEPSSSDVALATALFDDGRALMNKGKFAEACPKLAESHRLDPGGGVVLALALCREAEGKTASAWFAFEEALAFAKRDKRDDRKATVEEHLGMLRVVLSRLSISSSAGARAQGVTVSLDGKPLDDASLGTTFVIDPGEHRLVVTAPGKSVFSETITIARGEERTVVVAPLQVARNVEAPKVVAAPFSVVRAAGWVSLSLGALTLGVSAVYGVRAIGRRHDSESHCPDGACDAVGEGLHEQSKDAARVATVTLGIGTFAAAVGIVLVLTAPHTGAAKSSSAVALQLAPSIGNTNGLALTGVF